MQVLSYEYGEISKNTYFEEEHLRTAIGQINYLVSIWVKHCWKIGLKLESGPLSWNEVQ